MSSPSLVFGASSNLLLLELQSTSSAAAGLFNIRTLFVAHESEIQAVPALQMRVADLVPSAAIGEIRLTAAERSGGGGSTSAPALAFGYDLVVKSTGGGSIRIDGDVGSFNGNGNKESLVSASVLSSSLPNCDETTLCPASQSDVTVVREANGSRSVSLILHGLSDGHPGWQVCNLGMAVVGQPTPEELSSAAPKPSSWIVTAVINTTHALGLEPNASSSSYSCLSVESRTFASTLWRLIDLRAEANTAQLEPAAVVALSRRETTSYRVDIHSSMMEMKHDFGMRVGQVLTLDHPYGGGGGANRSWGWITRIVNATCAHISVQSDPWVLGDGMTFSASQVGFYRASRSGADGRPVLDASYVVHLAPCMFKHVSMLATMFTATPEKSTFAVDSGDSIEVLGVVESAGGGFAMGASA